MERAFLIALLFAGYTSLAQSRPVTVNDLLTLSSIAPPTVESYLGKKGFVPGTVKMQDGITVKTFLEKNSNAKPGAADGGRSIEIYKEQDTYYYLFCTASADEFQEGRRILKSAGFFYDSDTGHFNSMIFKKGAITVRTRPVVKENSQTVYNFLLQKKEFPDPGPISYAEDLLKFGSHDHLVHYFGVDNVKKDQYYFSADDPAPCSVLYPNSSRQVVFVWEDEIHLYQVSLILISGVLQATSTVKYDGNFGHNTWKSKSGISLGMRIGDLLKLNANDFSFYGSESEYSFMVVPEKTRYVDFKNVGVLLNCFDCYSAPLLKTEKVSAANAADEGLALYVSGIMLKPE